MHDLVSYDTVSNLLFVCLFVCLLREWLVQTQIITLYSVVFCVPEILNMP